MTTVTIGEKTYKIPDKWSELTLGRFIELSKIPIPEKLSEFIRAQMDFASDAKQQEKYDNVCASLTLEDHTVVFPEYYGHAFTVLCPELTPEEVDKLSYVQRSELHDYVLMYIVYTIVSGLPMEKVDGKLRQVEFQGIDSFELQGETYFFPKSLRMSTIDVPMAEEKIITFSESSAILRSITNLGAGGLESFPAVMAIYCRKKDEQYNEKMVIERNQIFLQCSMTTVWSLFFCITMLLQVYVTVIQSFMKSLENKLMQELSSQNTG